MALQEAVTRRQFLRSAGIGAAGLAGAALLGCTPDGKSTQINKTPDKEASITPDRSLLSPPEGYKIFRSTYLPYECYSPSNAQYLNQGQDIFILDTNQRANIAISTQEISNPSATASDYAQKASSQLQDYGVRAVVLTPSSNPLTGVGEIDSRLIELTKMKIDGRDTSIVFSSPGGKGSMFDQVAASAFAVDSKNGLVWNITAGYTSGSPTIFPSMLDKMMVMMRSFHVTK